MSKSANVSVVGVFAYLSTYAMRTFVCDGQVI